jgi:prepilin-type N-terminal cleavage/methylation domain-containing protein
VFKKTAFKVSSGFSLIELSMVIIIIGLIVAGTISAHSIVKAAKLRDVISDYYEYSTAFSSFKGQFKAIPGDFTKAHLYWGDDCGTNPEPTTNPPFFHTNGLNNRCSGNGDGYITWDGIGTFEIYKVFQHLYLAGYVSQAYTGNNFVSEPLYTGGEQLYRPGINVPKSSFGDDSYYIIAGRNTIPAAITWSNTERKAKTDYLFIVRVNPDHLTTLSYLSSRDSYNLDNKIDDSKADTGVFLSIDSNAPDITSSCLSGTSLYDLEDTSEGECKSIIEIVH